MKAKVKIVLTCFVTTLVLISVIFTAKYYLNKKVQSSIINLASKLSAELGHTVTIDKVTTNWNWLFLKITVTNLAILDITDQVPLFTVNSVVATVDAVKSIVTLSPKFSKILLRSPRMSIHWDGVEGPKIYGLYGSAQADFLDSRTVLQLLAMQEHIQIENGDLHIQGIADADLPLMDIKLEFKKKSNFKYSMLVRGEIAAANAPEFNFAMNYHGKLDDYLRAMIEFDFKTSNVQVEDVLNLFPQYSQAVLQGIFSTLDVRGAIQNGTLRYAKSDFTIDELAIATDNTITGGHGQLEFKAHDGEFKLTLQDFQHHNGLLFTNPTTINLVRGDVVLKMVDDKLELLSNDLMVKLVGMELMPIIKIKLHNNIFDSIEIDSKLRFAHVEKMLSILPDKKISPSLAAWLEKSLTDGYVHSAKFNYLNNKVHAEAYFKQVDLEYSDAWPSIDNIDGAVVLEDDDLYINVTKASILDHKVNQVTAKFLSREDHPYSLVIINGNIDATLEAGLEFIEESPLNATIGEKIAPYDPSGQMYLNLDLEIDVTKAEQNIKSSGTIEISRAVTRIPDIDLELREITGAIKFSNDTLTAEKLDLQMLGLPATAQINLLADKSKGLQIGLNAPLHIESLKQLFPDLVLDHISGETEIVASLQVPWNNDNEQKTLNISSTLLGVAIDYPLPFNKTAAEIMPLQLKYIIKDEDAKTVYLKFADLLEANILLHKGKMSGAHISFGHDKALLATQGDLFISGKLDKFDWDLWQPLLESKHPTQLPVEIDVLINKLVFHGEKYNSMWVKYDSKTKRVSLESPIVIGAITFSKEQDTIDIKLDKLDLGATSLQNNNVINYIKQKNKTKQLPLIQFYCEHLRMNKGEYRKVNVQLLPRTYGYEITDFSLSNDNILLQAQGQWQMENKESTQISGNAYTKNFGKVLEDWKYRTSISKGTGEINFALTWPGNPTEADLLNMDGTSHVELGSGIINGVDAGLGRIIGLLSLEALHRRIKLDFSDLNSKGLAFDKLESDLKLQAGVLSTDNILLSSPSARIELFGRAMLKTKQLDLTMLVVPKVSVGLPVAAAIAVGNPAIGAAIWLFDKASGYKIGEISSYKYKVTGTWDAPKIVEIKNMPKDKDLKNNDQKSKDQKTRETQQQQREEEDNS